MSNKKIVLHICIAERYVEGESYQENLLAAKHREQGYEVHIIASQLFFNGRTKQMDKRDVALYKNQQGINVHILKPIFSSGLLNSFFVGVRNISKVIGEISPSVIFVHGVTSLNNFEIVRYIKCNPSIKLFADNHNDYINTPQKGVMSKLRHSLARIYAKQLIPYTTRFWGTIPLRVEYLVNEYKIPIDKTGLLVMGADETKIKDKIHSECRKSLADKYDIPSTAFIVITGGAFDKRKRQDVLMEAISQLRDNNIWLVAFGEPVKGMEQVFEKFRNCENIIFTGWVKPDSVYDLFIASDLAVFPGTHSVLWEQAVACGVPVVAKRMNGIEHIDIDNNAILMDEMNVDSLKSQIEDLANTQRYFAMKKKADEVSKLFYLSSIATKSIEG